MRDYLVALIIAGLIPMTFIRPFVGILAWCWVSYMVPHRLGWGLVASWPVAMMIGASFLLAYAFSREPKKIPMKPIVVVHLIFIVWLSITFFFNPGDSHALTQFDSFLKIQLMTLLTIAITVSKPRIDALIAVITLSIAWFGVKGGIFTVLTGGNFRVWGPPGGFFEGNNELGLTLLTILPLLRYLQTQVTRAWMKHGLTFVIVTCFIAAVGTYSRGALLAAATMAAYFWWKSDKKVPIALALIIGLPLVYTFMPESWHERMATMKTDQSVEQASAAIPVRDSSWCSEMTRDMIARDASFGGRVNSWCFAFNIASSEVLGGGFNAFSRRNFDIYAPATHILNDAHSLYFKILGNHGFIGLFLFLLLLTMAWWRAGVIARIARKQNIAWAAQLGAMLQVSLVAFCVGGLFLGLCYFDLLYHLIALVVIADAVMAREINPQPSATPRFANSFSVQGRPA